MKLQYLQAGVLCCRGTTECSSRSIINIPVRMWLAGGRFFIRRIELTATGDVSDSRM